MQSPPAIGKLTARMTSLAEPEAREEARAASAAGAARALGVVFGGPAALAAGAAIAGLATGRAFAAGRRPDAAALAALAAVAAYAAVARPYMRTWGATPEEAEKPLPGDEDVPDAAASTTHAVTIDAPPEAVWPWLAQLGQDRGGFYSYEWLENLAGCEMRNADRIHPEWQHREPGETMLLHPATGLEVLRFEPPRLLTIENWGTLMLEPLPGSRTRLLVRSRRPRGLVQLLMGLLIELPHFLMERKMLLGIKKRAEAAWRAQGADEEHAS
jgi:hypothetical protein